MKRTIHSENGPPAQGPYSHATACGDLLFVSGQGPVDLTLIGGPEVTDGLVEDLLQVVSAHGPIVQES